MFIPLLAAIPLAHAMYICYDIWRHQLMPPSGKRRLLSLYFMRIVASYVGMWTPHLVLCLVGSGIPWMVFAGGSWGHFQGVVSAVIALTKPDMRKAFYRLLRCKPKISSHRRRVDHSYSRRRTFFWFRSLSTGIMARRNSADFISNKSTATDLNGSSHFDDYLPRQRADFRFEDEVNSNRSFHFQEESKVENRIEMAVSSSLKPEEEDLEALQERVKERLAK